MRVQVQHLTLIIDQKRNTGGHLANKKSRPEGRPGLAVVEKINLLS